MSRFWLTGKERSSCPEEENIFILFLIGMMILPSLSTAKQEGLSIIKSLPRGIIDLKSKIVLSFDKMCRQGLPQSRIMVGKFSVKNIERMFSR